MKILPLMPEQIAALHPGFARDAADQQRPVHAAKAFVQIGRRDHPFEERERAIIQFHDDAFERVKRRVEFRSSVRGPVVGTEHRAGRRCEKEASNRFGRPRR